MLLLKKLPSRDLSLNAEIVFEDFYTVILSRSIPLFHHVASETGQYVVIPSIYQTLHERMTLLLNRTLLPNLTLYRKFLERLQWVWHTDRTLIFPRTPGSIPFGTCIFCSVETSLSETCRVSELWISKIPLYFYFTWIKLVVILAFSCATVREI